MTQANLAVHEYEPASAPARTFNSASFASTISALVPGLSQTAESIKPKPGDAALALAVVPQGAEVPAAEQAMQELLVGLVPGLPPTLRKQILERAEGVVISKRFVTTGTTTVKAKSRWKPQEKLKSPSWENVGRALPGMLRVELANTLSVVKTELYETRAPPGKSEAAVSGDAP